MTTPRASSFFKDEGEHIMLLIEFDLMAEALVVEGIEDDSPRVVRGVTRPFHGLFP